MKMFSLVSKMVSKMLVLSASSGLLLQEVSAQQCSSGCEAQFVTCVTTDQNSYSFCSGEITVGNPNNPMGRAGCTATCTFTSTMQSHSGATAAPKAKAKPGANGTGAPGAGGGRGAGGGAATTCTTGPTVTPGASKVALPSTQVCYTVDGRSMHILAPPASAGSGPFPVFFLFHGNGGRGQTTLGQFDRETNAGTTSIKNSYILVAPDGESNSWNVVGEASTQDDVKFVSETLVNYFTDTFSNVKSEFEMLGQSNGAALVNRILIESTEARIKGGVTVVSQLNTHQFNNGNFYLGGSSNTYTQVQPSLHKRRLLQITGGADTMIPAAGGQSSIPSDANGGRLHMVNWEESVFRYATAYGYTGTQKSPVTTGTNTAGQGVHSVSYVADGVDVLGYNYLSAGHGSALNLNDEFEVGVLTNFLLATSTTTSTGTITTGAGSGAVSSVVTSTTTTEKPTESQTTTTTETTGSTPTTASGSSGDAGTPSSGSSSTNSNNGGFMSQRPSNRPQKTIGSNNQNQQQGGTAAGSQQQGVAGAGVSSSSASGRKSRRAGFYAWLMTIPGLYLFFGQNAAPPRSI